MFCALLCSARNEQMIELSDGYTIDKHWLRKFLHELDSALHESGAPAGASTSQKKQLKDKSQKLFEAKLSAAFDASPQPHWLNLVLIENCKDFKTTKYTAMSCLVSRTFDKWCESHKAALRLDAQDSTEARAAALVIGTKYNTLNLNAMVRCYRLADNESNSNSSLFFLFVKKKLALTDEWKDKANIIASLMLHDHFDLEEVTTTTT